MIVVDTHVHVGLRKYEPLEALLDQMNRNRVDKAVLVQYMGNPDNTYMTECMRAHPGPQFEMIHKCSCVLDGLATELKFDDYVTLSTLDKAMSIGGERGGSIRDAPSFEAQAKRYRELRTKTEASCFIGAGPR